MRSDRLYSIQELCDATGVSLRTIRYYTSEGLLPPPSDRGRNACYTEDHLNRLLLIKRLQAAHLPLEKIRRRIASLEPEDLEALLREADPVSEEHPPSGPPDSNRAKEYIERLLASGASTSRAPLYGNSVPSQPTPRSPASIGDSEKPLEETRIGGERGEIWQRIALLPGVELHVRGPLEPPVEQFVSHTLSTAEKAAEKLKYRSASSERKSES